MSFEKYDWREHVLSPAEMREKQRKETEKQIKKAREAGCESGHLDTKVVPGKGPHQAALRCAECDKWLKWMGKRELMHRQAQEKFLPPL